MSLVLGRRFFVALLVASITGVTFKASYFQENSEAYLFPSIVAIIILALSLISLVREAFDLCVDDFQRFPFRRQLAVILMMVVGVSLVEWLGIYSSAFILLMAVAYW